MYIQYDRALSLLVSRLLFFDFFQSYLIFFPYKYYVELYLLSKSVQRTANSSSNRCYFIMHKCISEWEKSSPDRYNTIQTLGDQGYRNIGYFKRDQVILNRITHGCCKKSYGQQDRFLRLRSQMSLLFIPRDRGPLGSFARSKDQCRNSESILRKQLI